MFKNRKNANDLKLLLFQQKTEQLANVGKEVETLNNNKKELEKKLRHLDRNNTAFIKHNHHCLGAYMVHTFVVLD